MSVYVAEARELYLDRILLDHESAFVLLQDFKKWEPQP